MKKYFGVGHKSLYFSHFSNVLVERNWNAKENFEYSFIQIGFSKTCQLLIISSDNIICKVLHLQCGNSLAVVGSMWGKSGSVESFHVCTALRYGYQAQRHF